MCSADPHSQGQGLAWPAKCCSRKQGPDGGLGSLNSKGQTQGSKEPRSHGWLSAVVGPRNTGSAYGHPWGRPPNGERAGLPPTLSRLALGGLSMWPLVQVRLKRCDTKTEAGSGHGIVWTRRLDVAPGHSCPRLGGHSPCAARGGRGSGQVSRPHKPPGPELLSYHLGARLSRPLPWTPWRRGRVPAPLRWGEAVGLHPAGWGLPSFSPTVRRVGQVPATPED